MKYFLDTEFAEGTQKKFFGETKPTIDLISIGLVDENGREYYAISKDFNLKEAWNRFDLLESNTARNHTPNDIRIYWLRDNVLLPIFFELATTDFHNTHFKDEWFLDGKEVDLEVFKKVWGADFKWFKTLIEKYGKSNKTIAEEVEFFARYSFPESGKKLETDIQFYGYYSAYDWVVFCWLFGKMMNLPSGFPMYCRDLKQIMDEKGLTKEWKHINCPDPKGAHNALVDAKWNLKLFNVIQINK